jgi:5-methylcytosine-specific restriction endonuclease McrA
MKPGQVPHLALYGSVGMQRAYCNACRGMALVIGGEFQCCDRQATSLPQTVKRISDSEMARRGPSADERRAILEEQEGRCLYCGLHLDSYTRRNGRPVRLRTEWDHVVPFSYSHCNRHNFVASCHVCNGIKGARLYQTLEDALADLHLRRAARGYEV